MADWYVWAAARRLQQAHRELDMHCRELSTFHDSMMLQLAQLQQYERQSRETATTFQPHGEYERAALHARIRTLLIMGNMFDEARSMLQFHAVVLGQMTAVARAAAPPQGDPTDN